MATYDFADVLVHTGVEENKVQRWCDAGIVETAGAGKQGRRRKFTFRNLVEIAVCDELRWLGVSEPYLPDVIRNLNRLWDGKVEHVRPNGEHIHGSVQTILWIGHQRVSYPPDETVHHTPVMMFTDALGVTSKLTDENETGIAVPVHRIIADLERATGDAFDFEATLQKKIADALRKALAKDDE